MFKRAFGMMMVSGVFALACAPAEQASGDAPEVTADGVAEKASMTIYGDARWVVYASTPSVSGGTLTAPFSAWYSYCTPGLCDEYGEPLWSAYGGGAIVKDLGTSCTGDVVGTPYKYCLSTSEGWRLHEAAGTPVRNQTWDPYTQSYSYNLSLTSGCGYFRTMGVLSLGEGACGSPSTAQDPNYCVRDVSAKVYFCQ